MSPHFRKKKPTGSCISFSVGGINMLVVSMESGWWLWTWSPIRWFTNSGITVYRHHHWGYCDCNMEALFFWELPAIAAPICSICFYPVSSPRVHEIAIVLGISLPITTPNNYPWWQLALIFLRCVFVWKPSLYPSVLASILHIVISLSVNLLAAVCFTPYHIIHS